MYEWMDGKKYIGKWIDNKMDGFGIYIWPNGRSYEGYFKSEKKCGYGIYVWQDDRKYEGWWNANKQHGLGMYIVKGKPIQNGLWENGKRLYWLSQEEVFMISNKTKDFTNMFVNEKSKSSCIGQTFDSPMEFIIEKEEHEKRVASLKVKIEEISKHL